MTFPSFEKYKELNLPWLKWMPDHWETNRVKFSTYVKGRVGWHGLNSNEFLSEGDFYLVTGTDFIHKEIIWETCYRITEERYEEDSYIHLKDRDLLITKDGTIGKLAIVSNIPNKASVNSGVFVTRPLRNEYDTNFMYYVLSSAVFKSFINYYKTGTTINHLYQEIFENFEYSFPPHLDEQQSIAAFLDYKTKHIDNLIEKKEQLLRLLEEKRNALITQAVTKGLSPNVKMKPSGIDWLGEIPEHWEVWKLTHSFQLIGSGTTPKSDNAEYYDGEFPWVTTSELRESVICDTKQKITEVALQDYSTLKFYDEGSVLIAMYGATIGRLGILGVKATVNQACCVFSKPTNIDPKFFFYWLLMWRPILISLSSGGGQPNLNQDELKKIKIPIPSLVEQTIIVEYLKMELDKMKTLEIKVSDAIDRLREYRTALITAAVTGKIDLRDFKPPREV